MKDKIPAFNGSGIYGIRNTRTKKLYVGSTTEIRRRLLEHVNDLSKGVHRSKKLQHAWNQSEGKAFEFLILEKVPEKDLVFAEQKHIEQALKDNLLYNASKIASRQGVRAIKAQKKQELTDELYRMAPVTSQKGNPFLEMAFAKLGYLAWGVAGMLGLVVTYFWYSKVPQVFEASLAFFGVGFLGTLLVTASERFSKIKQEHRLRLKYVEQHLPEKLKSLGIA